MKISLTLKGHKMKVGIVKTHHRFVALTFVLSLFVIADLGRLAGVYDASAEAATLDVCLSGCEYSSIQAAIQAAGNNDTVLVHEGTYVESMQNINFMGKPITVRSEKGPDVTIIDGNQGGSVVTFDSGEGSDSVLDGFTVINGKGTDLYSFAEEAYGGGILCINSSAPLIANCIIRNNTAHSGGGIFCSESSPRIENCTITDNQVQAHGSGIYCCYSSPIIKNCLISSNAVTRSFGNGGGIYTADYSSPRIEKCIIIGNSVTEIFGHGGGIYTYSHSSPTVIHSTLIGNTTGKISNEIHVSGQSSIDVTYTKIMGGWPGIGNSNITPLLVNLDKTDLYAQFSAGSAASVPFTKPVARSGQPAPGIRW